MNAWSAGPSSPDNGTIEIQTWVGADGVPHHIVYVPGTDDLTTTPWTQDGDVRDLHTNLTVIGGGATAYGEGILQAMHDAGISPDDPVMIVGHSQGGMEAVWAAGHGDFNVTQVVTAGSPVGAMGEPPADTAVLANFLPLHHIVLLRKADLLAYLEDYATLVAGQPMPRNVNLITGASGTTDIEGSLVLGAHGPRYMHVVVAGS